MICVDLFYHCDFYECESHAYVQGDVVAFGETTHALPKSLPEGWREDNGKVYCGGHRECT